MKKKITEQTYSQAFLQLQQLVAQIEDDNLQLDLLAPKIDEAKSLLIFCEQKLRTIEKEIKE
jgi:exodeoxyribonuclease VII small subunit